MCNLSKGVEERGIAIGLERGPERGIEITTLNADGRAGNGGIEGTKRGKG